MRTLGPIRRVVLGIAAITLAAATAAAAEFRVQAELVSAVRDVQAGTPFWVAIRQRIDPGWHTYWRNPGDTGEPTRLSGRSRPGQPPRTSSGRRPRAFARGRR